MARIARIELGTQDVRPHRTDVDCYIQTIASSTGETMVHLSTFGSVDRTSQPKSSQSMQFDRESAAQLISYFVAAFGKDIMP